MPSFTQEVKKADKAMANQIGLAGLPKPVAGLCRIGLLYIYMKHMKLKC